MVNHTCRHRYTSQNILAICDFDMRFIFVVAGCLGFAHDSRIHNHALANLSSFPVPPKGKKIFFLQGTVINHAAFGFANPSFIGKYYLVDSGYANRVGYLAPFKGSTYHILEFRHRSGRPPQGKYEMFNFLHSSLRNVIERSFGVLKQKWRILKGISSLHVLRSTLFLLVLHCIILFVTVSCMIRSLINVMLMRTTYWKRHPNQKKMLV